MNDIIDFDAGTVIKGVDSIRSCSEKLLDFALDVASGKKEAKARKCLALSLIMWYKQ